MKKKAVRLLAVFSTALLILSTLIVAAGAFETSEGSETIVQVRMTDGNDLSELSRSDLKILERYESFVLIEADEEKIDHIESSGMEVNELPKRTQVTVKGHTFDIDEGPDVDLTIDGYEEGTEGLHVVHMLGPVHPEWRATLEGKGVNIINYVPNYAYEVSMTPEVAEEVEDLFFVDWVGIYQPEFKLHSRLDEALDEDMSVNVRLRPGFEPRSLMELESRVDVIGAENLRENGYRLVVDTEDMDELEDIAMMEDVYFISPYIEPELHGEMDSQIIGGGCWFMDDEYEHSGGDHREGDPDQPYRKHGDHGAYINQIGYTGEGVTITIADTGIGDGTEGDAGHPDLTGRVIGGYGFGSDPDNWADGHGHGTHCTGSAAGDTYGGTGETFGFADYYMAQGLAYESEIFATKIFDDGGGFMPTEYYPIVEEPAQRSDAYVHSNSWGAGTSGAYSDSDEVFDQTVRDADRDIEENRPMTITVSAGNDGARGDQTTGSPGNSKNVITVGATQTYNPDDGYTNAEMMAGFSSRGWTEDNRVKPDVVATGEGIYSLTPGGGYQEMSGTSMSNPAVAGAAAVVVEWYEENFGERPSPAMVRSILINTAIELDPEVGDTRGHIPNRDEGWGIVDISKLEYPTDDPLGFVFEDQETLLETGDIDEHIMSIEDEDEPFKVTLSWTDKNALEGDSEGGTPTLKNNLNLEVETPGGDIIRGNAFDLSGDGDSDDGFTHPDAEVMADFDYNDDGWDDVNNVQNVYIPPDDVETGTYTVRVIGTDIPEDANNDGNPNQDYALTAYNAAEGAAIEVLRPVGGEYREYWETGTEEEILWETTEGIGNITHVDLMYSVDGGGSWSYIDEGIDDTGSYLWLVPDEPSHEAMVKAIVHDDHPDTGEGIDTSDEFTITDVTPPEVTVISPNGGEEWHAGDEEEITWNTEEGDEPIESVDIQYSVDGGTNWILLEEGIDDTGSYIWRIPDETTSEALVQIWVHCEGLTTHYDRSDDHFDLVGIPPEPPENLEVEYVNDDNLVTWTKSAGDWSDHMMSSESKVEVEQTDYESNSADNNYENAPDVLADHAAERPESREYDQNKERLLQNEYYAFEVYPGDDSLWFPPDDPGDLNYIAPNEADNFIAAGTWVIDTWYGAQFEGGLWTIDETDGSMDFIGDTPGFNGLAYDDSTGTLYGATGDALYTVDPDTGDSEQIGNFGIADTMIAIASDGYGGMYGTTVDFDTEADLYSIDVDTGEADSIGNTGLHLLYAQDMEYDKNTHTLYHAAYLESGPSGLYELDTDTGASTHIGDFPDGEEIAGFAIPYILEGVFFSADIVSYEANPDPGDEVIVNYTVTNLGDEEDTQEINFTVNGLVEDSVEVTLGENEEYQDEFVWDTSRKVGSYYLGIETEDSEDEVMVMIGDTKRVSHYNVYQAEDQNGPWDEPIAQVDADGSSDYEFLDEGAAGQPYDWYIVRAVAEDGAEERNRYAVREPGGPEVNTLSPEDHEIIIEDDVTVEWEGSDEIGNYEVQLNDEDMIDVGTDTEHTFENIPEGIHQVFVFGHHETTGEVGYDSVYFMVDQTPPDLEILYPEDESYINETAITVEWAGYEDVSGIDHYSVRVDGGNWTDVGLDTTFDLDELEHTETYTIDISVKDWAGWETTESTTFTIDTVSPGVEILFPEDDGWAPIDLTAEWYGEDEVSGIDNYEVRLDHGEWIDVGDVTEHEFTDLTVEEHTLEVRAWDRAGNRNVTSASFDIDPEPPHLQVVSPEEGNSFDTDKVSIAWSGVDKYSGLSHIDVRLGEEDWINVAVSSSYTFTDLEEGTHTATVRATDNVQQETYDDVTFTVDTTPPQLSIVSPERGAIYDEGDVTVEWQGSDDTSGIDFYEVRLDYGEWMNVGNDEAYTFEDLDDGDHTVEVRATDGVGHTASEAVSFTVDTSPPEISILSPDEDELFDSNEVMIVWDSSDETTGISRHEVRVNGGEWIDVGGSSFYTVRGLDDGDHTVEVRARDEAGNTEEDDVSFTVDTTPPEVEIVSPEPGAVFAEDEVTVEWEGSDDTSGIETFSIRIGQGEWRDVSTASQYTFDGLSDGEHFVEVMAQDEAGHTTTRTLSFTVDTTAPELFIISPDHEQILNKDEVTVRWSGSDKLSGLSHYEVRLNQGEWIDVGTETHYTFEGLSEGENTVEVRAVDEAGNEATEEITFEVDESIAIYWWIIIALVILAILLLVLMVMVFKSGEEEEEQSEPVMPPAAPAETEDNRWHEEGLYGEPAEEEGSPTTPEQSDKVPAQEEVFVNGEPDGEEPPPPPPEPSESSEDLLGELEEES